MNLYSSSKYPYQITRPTSCSSITTQKKQFHPIQTALPHCLYHPTNTLYNFCCCQQCLLPMCATCLEIHNEQHLDNKTYGKYLSLENIRQNIHNQYYNTIKYFENLSLEYTQDYQDKIKIKDIFDRINKQIQRILNQIQNQMVTNIQRYLETIYDQYQNIQEKIHQNYNKIKKQINNLSTQKCIKSIIQYYSFYRAQLHENKVVYKNNINNLKIKGLEINPPENLSIQLQQIFKQLSINQIDNIKFGQNHLKWIKKGNKKNYDENKII